MAPVILYAEAMMLIVWYIDDGISRLLIPTSMCVHSIKL